MKHRAWPYSTTEMAPNMEEDQEGWQELTSKVKALIISVKKKRCEALANDGNSKRTWEEASALFSFPISSFPIQMMVLEIAVCWRRAAQILQDGMTLDHLVLK